MNHEKAGWLMTFFSILFLVVIIFMENIVDSLSVIFVEDIQITATVITALAAVVTALATYFIASYTKKLTESNYINKMMLDSQDKENELNKFISVFNKLIEKTKCVFAYKEKYDQLNYKTAMQLNNIVTNLNDKPSFSNDDFFEKVYDNVFFNKNGAADEIINIFNLFLDFKHEENFIIIISLLDKETLSEIIFLYCYKKHESKIKNEPIKTKINEILGLYSKNIFKEENYTSIEKTNANSYSTGNLYFFIKSKLNN